MPGFSADTSLYNRAQDYRATAGRSVAGDNVVASELNGRSAGRPFSGSCGCWPGICCCVLCYFDNCYWWCWSPSRVGF
jgi:hypothetical protein